MRTGEVVLAALVSELASQAVGAQLAPTIFLVSGVVALLSRSERAFNIAAGSGAVVVGHLAYHHLREHHILR